MSSLATPKICRASSRVGDTIMAPVPLRGLNRNDVSISTAGIRKASVLPLPVRAVVITGAGRIFCAGADITEFGKPPVAPTLPDLLSGVEESVKPVVAAINGAALGGGCELTLACHGRVGSAAAAIGLHWARSSGRSTKPEK